MLFLLLSGDVSLNPGHRNWKYPCSVCHKPVTKNQDGLQCDQCDVCLPDAIRITKDQYVTLSNPDTNWYCYGGDSFFNSRTDDSTPDAELTGDTSDGDDEVRLFPELRQLQDQFRKNFKLGHFNINSVRNKFGPISELLGENFLQYLAITESKIDNSFPDSQFSVPNVAMYIWDKNQHGTRVLTDIRSDVPNRRLTVIDTNYLEIIINEIMLCKVK